MPKENEARSVKGSYNGDVMGGKLEDGEMGKKDFGGSARAANVGAMSAKKSSLEEEAEGLKDMEEKKRAPSICSCEELSFYHSRNLHANTSLERQKK